MRLDRQQNVRRAFRSFPLHELPLAARTINPFVLYETHLAGRSNRISAALCLAGLGRASGSASGASTAWCTKSSIPKLTASWCPSGYLLGSLA